jgi:putative membrane protein insertion efficiency factor
MRARCGDEDAMSSRTTHTAFRVYKSALSPMLQAISPSQCLYLPTCSEYAYTAISRFGWWHGSWMALRRLARCHPWAKGGLDPVPQHGSSDPAQTNSSACNQKDADHLP